jgi:hypothetical protein
MKVRSLQKYLSLVLLALIWISVSSLTADAFRGMVAQYFGNFGSWVFEKF